MSLFICYNGNYINADAPIVSVQNRSFKWGDGLFETIKVWRHKILLGSYHFDRLFTGLHWLQIRAAGNFTAEILSSRIIELCELNNCSAAARVRLAVYRDDKGEAAYSMEAFSVDTDINCWNPIGYSIDIYPDAAKSIDAFANLKTASYLPYVMAALYAKEKGLDDCLVLNGRGAVCDSSKANIFIIKRGELFTPALEEGCISGVMRRHLLQTGKRQGYTIQEGCIGEEDLYAADEIFLTNAIIGMRWVSNFKQKVYSNNQSAAMYKALIEPLYQ